MSLLSPKYVCLLFLVFLGFGWAYSITGEHGLTQTNCFLVTADVASLYPNVDTKKALVALDLLLQEARVPETPLLIQLARRVLENNYLSSKLSPDIFHQVFGIAMGTPFAVTVANAFMYHHEKDIVEYYSQYLALYKRFIDDILLSGVGPKVFFWNSWVP